MRRVLALAGVDYTQWRALMRAYHLVDWGPLAGGHDSRETLFALLRLLLMAAFLAVAGAGPALVVLAARDPLVGAMAMTSVTMWLTAASFLAQASSLVLPDDYALIGFRPVTSRTYFAVRLGAVLSQAVEMAVLIGWPSVLAFLARAHGSWRMAVAAAAAVAASTVAIALALVVVCSALLLIVTPQKLQRAVQYTQLVSMLGITIAYVLVWMAILDGGRAAVAAHVDVELPRRAALLLLPPTWFASYVTVAAGSAARFDLVAALLSLVCLGLLAASLRGRLSTDYAVRVAQLATEPAAAARGGGRGRAFLRGERRAMALLLIGQLRGDLAVQSGALMSLVTSALVLVGTSVAIGLPHDPFVDADGSIVEMVVLFMVPNIRETLTRSKDFEASWPFFTTPADRAALLAGSRDALATCLLAPMLAGVGALFFYAFGHPGHALTHLALMSLAAYLVLQVHVLISPSLPFSRPLAAGQRGLTSGLLSIPASGGAMAIVLLFEFVLYRSAVATAAGLATLAGLVFALNRATRWRAAHRGAAYAG